MEGSMGDKEGLLTLYRIVARLSGGIARQEDEITEAFVDHKIKKATANGIMLLAFDKHSNELAGAIHASKPGIKVFQHVMNDLTILIHPHYQGRGLGKYLFSEFLNLVKKDHPDIYRVELFCSKSNSKAISLYQKLGFKIEGIFVKRVSANGLLDDDIAMAWFNPDYNTEL